MPKIASFLQNKTGYEEIMRTLQKLEPKAPAKRAGQAGGLVGQAMMKGIMRGGMAGARPNARVTPSTGTYKRPEMIPNPTGNVNNILADILRRKYGR
jgi:hypothetical protein